MCLGFLKDQRLFAHDGADDGPHPVAESAAPGADIDGLSFNPVQAFLQRKRHLWLGVVQAVEPGGWDRVELNLAHA
jgi:hypothetical protein